MNKLLSIKTRRPLLVFMVFLGLLSYSEAQQVYEHQYLVKVGDQAPDFKVTLSDGSLFQLSQQRGKVVMLQFTASWCSVCRKEMPHIEKDIWNQLKGQDFVLIGLDYKENKKRVIDFQQQMNITYPLAIDSSGSVFKQYAEEGAGVTRNVIIDKNGKIIYLTRLFKMEEFHAMKKRIFEEVRP